jgi:PAS domain S-box-containing protein
MLRWVKTLLAPPVFEGDTDKTRAARLLHIILLTLFARGVLIRVITGSDPPRASFVLPFLVLLIALMILMRRGEVCLASIMTVFSFWLSLTAAAIVTGGIHSAGFRNYILPVLVAGLLLGRGAAVLTAGLSIIVGVVFWAAEVHGIIGVPSASADAAELLVTHAISFLMAAILVTLATRSIQEALGQARREIAERKAAETAARGSEERFSKAFNLSPLRMGIVRNRDGGVVAFNEVWLREMGFTREETIGRSIFDLTAWIGDEGPRIRQIVEDGTPIRNWEAQARTKLGEKRSTLVSAEPIELSGEPCMLWVSNDITERKRSEEALRQSEELFRISFENATVGLCLVGTDGRFLSVNPKLCEMLGYTIREFDEMTFNDITYEADKRIGAVFFAQAIDGIVTSTHIEKRYLHKNGRIIWAFVSSAFVRAPGENRRFFITYIQDITERKEAEERLRATSEQLRALMTGLRSAREEEGIRIAREIHDELGSSLTGLRWDLEELDRGIAEGKNTPNPVQLHEKINAMRRLVDSTIDSVRRISSELRPSILDDLGLAEAVEWQAQQFEARTGITCRYDCWVDNIDLDEEQSTAVFRIFQEALTNVLRHAEATRIDVSLEGDRNELVLRIQDNGRGIRDDEKSGPSSLGLLGMRERANLIHGTLEIRGVEGKGTAVILRVPHPATHESAATA